MIFDKPPDLSKRDEVLDLQRRELADDDPGTRVELMIQFDRRLRPLHARSLPDGFAVDQQA
jgi:hypothetical protein